MASRDPLGRAAAERLLLLDQLEPLVGQPGGVGVAEPGRREDADRQDVVVAVAVGDPVVAGAVDEPAVGRTCACFSRSKTSFQLCR